MTLADVQAQEIIAEALSTSFPGIPIVGEEDGLDEDPGHGARWYVDPIDGTGAYLEGLAYWGPTVGLVVDDTPEVGALWLPRLQTFFVAKRGEGAWCDGLRLTPPALDQPRPRDVLYVPSRFHQLGAFDWRGKTRSLGSTAVHLAHVASGAGIGAIIGRWSPWDIACGLLLVEEANRVITALNATPLRPLQGVSTMEASPTGAPFLAGDPGFVEHIAERIERLRQADDRVS